MQYIDSILKDSGVVKIIMVLTIDIGHNDIDYTAFLKGTAKMPCIVPHSRPFGTCIIMISLIETCIRV